MRFFLYGSATAALLAMSAPVLADNSPASSTDILAQKFGHREDIIDVSLSPDGQQVVYISPGDGQATFAIVSSVDGSHARPIARAAGDPLHLEACDWSSPHRVVCKQYGVAMRDNVLAPFTRTVAVDDDGTHIQPIGLRNNVDKLRISQFDGQIIDWLSGTDGTVLMTRDYVPDNTTAIGNFGSGEDGIGVDLVDTVTGRGKRVEAPIHGNADYLSDGRGAVRIMSSDRNSGSGDILSGVTRYSYRLAGEQTWRPFSQTDAAGGNALIPIAVDGQANVAYALRSLDGRDALYRVALDGSMKTELVYANPNVDVRGVVTIGRGGRVIGASYTTDRRQIEYFDPQYRALARALGKALPKLPLIYFLSASANERKLLIFAGSDVDPGHYYVFDRDTHHLDELTPARPELEGLTLSPVRSITYPAADGTNVPAYLTLPPGSSGQHLPAIVMPHGGPSARDEWGFDWLAQYFAQRGFAVLQPEFRGSSGYGDAWYVQNGFKSWKTAIGDITDGARWLEKEGIADPAKMAIVGWSYGGYAALQANVADPVLFKAVVAIAPVTDLGMMKSEAQDYTNSRLVARFIGDGPHIAEGSPARHADRFQAPVLMFHGDQDINVAIEESRTMDKALKRAGKSSELIVFKGLDHQLDDSKARADMLAKADGFLRSHLGMQ
jgi:dipeptidyl aminopeptidase/acylaminoacyl peptidase